MTIDIIHTAATLPTDRPRVTMQADIIHTAATLPTDRPRVTMRADIIEAARRAGGATVEFRPYSDTIPAVLAVVGFGDASPDVWVLVRLDQGHNLTTAWTLGGTRSIMARDIRVAIVKARD